MTGYKSFVSPTSSFSGADPHMDMYYIHTIVFSTYLLALYKNTF